MDKDRIKGSAEQAKGKVKEVAGKVLGDFEAEIRGQGRPSKRQGAERRRRHQGYTARQVKICCCVARTEPHHGLFFYRSLYFSNGSQADIKQVSLFDP